MISEKEIKKILASVKGEIRGIGLRTDWEYVLHKEGKEGLQKLEKTLQKYGINLRFSEIEDMDFYPLSWDLISLLVIQDLFGYKEEDLLRMGETAAKFSLILRLFLKYFVSLKLVLSQATKMWRSYYTIGRLEPVELNEKEGYVRIALKDFDVHPIYCTVLRGYFEAIAKMIIGKEVTSQEEKCSFRGDDYHQFKISWQP